MKCQTITHELPRINPFSTPQHQQNHNQHQPHHGYHGYISPLRPGYHWPQPSPKLPQNHQLLHPHPQQHHPISQIPDVTKYVSTIKYTDQNNNAPFSLEESTNLEENIERPTREEETVNTTSTDSYNEDITEGKISEQELPDETFNFGYAVKDDKHGDDFSHQVANDGATTNGEYRVALPDGRVQVY